MRPKPREDIDYERVKVDDFLVGIIEEIVRDENHKHTYQGVESIKDSIRFKFKLEGYEYPHYSKWLTFNYGEKTNLLNKYLLQLVEGAYADMDFSLDRLKGMKVKILWSEKRYENGNIFQFVDTIRPVGQKIPAHQESVATGDSGASGAIQDDSIDLDAPPVHESQDEIPF